MSFIRNNLERYLLDTINGRKRGILDRLLYGVLFFMSILYSILLRIWLFLYLWDLLKRHKLPVRVISVGNITVGGTGKTPMVLLIARYFHERGKKVVVLSRGYKARLKESVVVSDEMGLIEEDATLVGDEAYILARSLKGIPVIVGANRVKNGMMACERFSPDVIILDDGFQYLKLARDLDIVLVDATNPFGNGNMLPAGLLREPVSSLCRADCVILTKTNLVDVKVVEELKERIRKSAPKVKILESEYGIEGIEKLLSGELVGAEAISGKNLVAFSGIGNPDSFYSMIEKSGGNVLKSYTFPDHYTYSSSDIEFLTEDAERLNAELITTEKDAVSIPAELYSDNILVFRVYHFLRKWDEFTDILGSTFKEGWLFLSNGYGEDVVTRSLIMELGDRYRIYVLPIVGNGRIFDELGVFNIGPVSMLPSGGIIKYQWTAIFKDIMAGLIGIIWKQLISLRVIKHRVSKVICVGDVYVFLLAVVSTGRRPVLVGIAKSVFIRGYFWIEKIILKRWAGAVFCRDVPTQETLKSYGIDAMYVGNPIMDGFDITGKDFGIDKATFKVVGILPGSRGSVYKDMDLLLDAVEYIYKHADVPVTFIMALSRTVDICRLKSVFYKKGWNYMEDAVEKDGIRIIVEREAFGDVIAVADIVIGFAGTGNQQAAGIGKPVVSVRNKGKLIQKMLLGESEVLVDYDYVQLARETLSILMDEDRMRKMGTEGRLRMGTQGAVSCIVRWLEGGFYGESDGSHTSQIRFDKISR